MAKFIMYFKEGTSRKERHLSVLGFVKLMVSDSGSLLLNDCVTKIDVLDDSDWSSNLDKIIANAKKRFEINGKIPKNGDLVKVYTGGEYKEVVFDHINEDKLLMIDSDGKEHLEVLK